LVKDKQPRQGPSYETTPRLPETTPLLSPSTDYTYVLNAVMKMEHSMGQITEAVSGLKESRTEQNHKLDKISDDIHTIKTKIYTAVAILLIAGSVTGAILGIFGKPIVELIFNRSPQTVTPTTAPAQAPVPESEPRKDRK